MNEVTGVIMVVMVLMIIAITIVMEKVSKLSNITKDLLMAQKLRNGDVKVHPSTEHNHKAKPKMRKERTTLRPTERMELYQHHLKHPKMKKVTLAEYYNVHPSTVTNIINLKGQ